MEVKLTNVSIIRFSTSPAFPSTTFHHVMCLVPLPGARTVFSVTTPGSSHDDLSHRPRLSPRSHALLVETLPDSPCSPTYQTIIFYRSLIVFAPSQCSLFNIEPILPVLKPHKLRPNLISQCTVGESRRIKRIMNSKTLQSKPVKRIPLNRLRKA